MKQIKINSNNIAEVILLLQEEVSKASAQIELALENCNKMTYEDRSKLCNYLVKCGLDKIKVKRPDNPSDDDDDCVGLSILNARDSIRNN